MTPVPGSPTTTTVDPGVLDALARGVVHVTRTAPLRWQAWSPGLVNPRYGLTAEAAVRRAAADLDHEWRTGRIPRQQRRPH